MEYNLLTVTFPDNLSISSRLRHTIPERRTIANDVPNNDPHQDYSGTLVLTPPAYDTLPKEPPAYQSVFELQTATTNNEQRHNNESYVNAGFTDANEELPPPYTPSASTTSDVRLSQPQSEVRTNSSTITSTRMESYNEVSSGSSDTRQVERLPERISNTVPTVTHVQGHVHNS